MAKTICLHAPEEHRDYYIFGYYGSLLDSVDDEGICRVGLTELNALITSDEIDFNVYSQSGFVLDYTDLENITADPKFVSQPEDFPPYLPGVGELLAVGVYLKNVNTRGIRLYGVGRAISEVENFMLECYADIVTPLSATAQRALAVQMVVEGYDMIGSLAATVVFIDSMKDFVDSDDYTPIVTDSLLANNVYRELLGGRLQPDMAAAVGRSFDKALTPLWWANGM